MALSYPSLLKWFAGRLATIARVYFAFFVPVIVVSCAAKAADPPSFRKVEPQAGAPATIPGGVLRLLADSDFPPFSFRNVRGEAAGLSVDLALLACADLQVRCSVSLRNHGELTPALLRKEGDVVVSGLRLDETLLNSLVMTRPYFWSLGRFVAKKDFKSGKADAASLGEFKIGYVDSTAHAAWLEKYYSGSSLKGFKSEAELHAALKAGDVDLLFEDNLRASFWLSGSDSAGCCKAVGEPFVDRGGFSHNLVYLARRDDGATVKALDAALDRLQDSGATAKLMTRYLPVGFW